jgi:hypothetical protein
MKKTKTKTKMKKRPELYKVIDIMTKFHFQIDYWKKQEILLG